MDREGIKKSILGAIEANLLLESYAVFLFGSRISNQAKKYTDYDIGLYGIKSIPLRTLSKIEDKIDDPPFDVDLIDFKDVSEDFKKIGLFHIEIWNKSEKINLKYS